MLFEILLRSKEKKLRDLKSRTFYSSPLTQSPTPSSPLHPDPFKTVSFIFRSSRPYSEQTES